ncbi:MAG: ApeA N-terminal domain 1-containing protein [Thermoleophilia bacterium]
MDNYDLCKSYDLRGEWWLPSKIHNKQTGTLKLKARQGVYLDLDGALEVNRATEFRKHSFIFGVTESGIPITLLNCQSLKMSMVSGGYYTTSYLANTALIGKHFRKKEQLKFTNAYFWLYNSDEWLNRKAFEFTDRHDYENMIIKYSYPKENELYKDTTTKIINGFSVSGPTYSFVQKDVHIEQEAYFKIIKKRTRELDDYYEIISAIQTFLALAIRGPVYPKRIQVVHKGDIRNQIQVYYAAVVRPAEKLKSPHNMVFTFQDIKEKHQEILSRWIENWPLLKPICDIYFGILYGKELYMENKFLGMAQVLETYHRRFIGGQYQNEEEYKRGLYKQLIDAIPKTVEADYRSSIKNKMKYMYEYSLRKRLNEIIDCCPAKIVDLLIGDSKAKKKFIKNTVNTRNYFTHYSKELEVEAVSGEELYWLYRKMKILIEIMMFKEMGFDNTRICDFINQNNEYAQEFERGHLK